VKKINIMQIDSRSGYVIDTQEMVLHIEKNVDSGKRIMIIEQGGKAHVMMKFEVDKDGNVSDFETMKIIDSHNGMTLMKE